ncbi:50S ribosomal protein L25 [Bdellovibrio sp. HCB337]|uniref:50S ribosomal protein L25 n=1 Tax=Bdellovibrio sp. HCB337 TaxID=3394358 RepID=UPI0039A51F3E
MKQRIDLAVAARETGKHNSRAIRNNRHVPGVVYGAIENANVTIDEKFIVKYNTRAFENALFNLKSDNGKLNGKVVLMKSVDVHPLTRRPVHVDLFALDMTKTVRVFVEVKLEGKPIGIAEGGLLNVVSRQIEVECLPTDIPESFTADVSNLGVGDALHVSDLTLPSTVKVMSRPEDTIAVVVVQEEEVAATPAAAAAPAAGAAAPAAGAAAPAKDAKAATPAKK